MKVVVTFGSREVKVLDPKYTRETVLNQPSPPVET